jgi:hypothetical protein
VHTTMMNLLNICSLTVHFLLVFGVRLWHLWIYHLFCLIIALIMLVSLGFVFKYQRDCSVFDWRALIYEDFEICSLINTIISLCKLLRKSNFSCEFGLNTWYVCESNWIRFYQTFYLTQSKHIDFMKNSKIIFNKHVTKLIYIKCGLD